MSIMSLVVSQIANHFKNKAPSRDGLALSLLKVEEDQPIYQ